MRDSGLVTAGGQFGWRRVAGCTFDSGSHPPRGATGLRHTTGIHQLGGMADTFAIPAISRSTTVPGPPTRSSRPLILGLGCVVLATACVPRPVAPPTPACQTSSANTDAWELADFNAFTVRIPPGYDDSLGRVEETIPGFEWALAYWIAGPARRILLGLGGGAPVWPWLPELRGHTECRVEIEGRVATFTTGWDGEGRAPPAGYRKYILAGTWDVRPGRRLTIRALTPDPAEQDILLGMLQSVRIKPDTSPVLSAEEMLWRAAAMGRYSHDGTPDSVRTRLVEPAAIEFFTHVLEGRREVVYVDSSAVLHWVAESGKPSNLGVLLEHSHYREKSDIGSFPVAVYGLARLAPDIPAARQRLETIATTGTSEEQYFLTIMLMTVNDSTARSILRLVPDEALRPAIALRRDRVLAAPGLNPGEGVRYCPERQERRRDAAGTYRCMPH